MRAANSRCVSFAPLRPSAISSPNVFMSLCSVPCLLRRILSRLHADVISDASSDAYRQPGAAHVVRSPCEQHFEAPALSTEPRAAPDSRVAADAQLAGLRDKRVSAPGLPVARGPVRGARRPPYSDGAWKTLSCLKREATQWQESGGRNREIARLLFEC